MEIKVLALCFISVITNTVFANNNIGNLLQNSWNQPQSVVKNQLSEQRHSNNHMTNKLSVSKANNLDKTRAELKQALKRAQEQLHASGKEVLHQFSEIQRLFIKQNNNSNSIASPSFGITEQFKASNKNLFSGQSASIKNNNVQHGDRPHSMRERLSSVNPDVSHRNTDHPTVPRGQGMIRQQRSLQFSPTSDLGTEFSTDTNQPFSSPMVPTNTHHFGFRQSSVQDPSSSLHPATTSLSLDQPQILSSSEPSHPIVDSAFTINDLQPTHQSSLSSSQNVFDNSFNLRNENPLATVPSEPIFDNSFNNLGSISGGSFDNLGQLISSHHTQTSTSVIDTTNASPSLHNGVNTPSISQTTTDLLAKGNRILNQMDTLRGNSHNQDTRTSTRTQSSVGTSWLQNAINNMKSNDEEDSSSQPMDYPMDQIIAQINTQASDAEGPFNSAMSYDAESRMMLTEYDMAFTPEDIQRKFPHGSVEPQQPGVKKRKKRALLRNTTLLWPRGRIPYVLEHDVFSSREERELRMVFNEWEKYTCVSFIPARQGDPRALYFKDSMGCHSFVGMKSMRRQTVGLKRACRHKKIMLHEVGHAIGMYHEQARPDRDKYLEIQYRNIPPPVRFNFDKINLDDTHNFSVPYDYLSIMHYGEKAFSTNKNGITMRTTNPHFQKTIGTAKRLSFRDVKSVNLMYKCSANCPRNIQCSHPEAFVGKNCKCWCPTHLKSPESAQLCPQPRLPPRRWIRPQPRPRPRPFLPKHLQQRLTTPPTTNQGSSNTRIFTNELADLLRRRRLEMQRNPIGANFYLFPRSWKRALRRRLIQSLPPRVPRNLLRK